VLELRLLLFSDTEERRRSEEETGGSDAICSAVNANGPQRRLQRKQCQLPCSQEIETAAVQTEWDTVRTRESSVVAEGILMTTRTE